MGFMKRRRFSTSVSLLGVLLCGCAAPVGTEASDGELLFEKALPSADIASAKQALQGGNGCADGTVEQVFGRTIVGCAGSVTWDQRESLCGPGYHVVSAKVWHNDRDDTVPSHHYWTNDDLRYSGSASSCRVAYSSGNKCPETEPMRVCGPSTYDPEGNRCNWRGCSLADSVSHGSLDVFGFRGDQSDYFGGCSGNTTAGALCVRDSPCADGSVEQYFDQGTAGCAGAVTFEERHTLCSAGFIPVPAGFWLRVRGETVPTHHYWALDGDLGYTGSASNCSVVKGGGYACPEGEPMRICAPSYADPEGNHCNWRGCSYESSGENDYLGGCAGNDTAGTVCMPFYCTDGHPDQNWNVHMNGCAGRAAFADRGDTCGPRSGMVDANNWSSLSGNLPPTHNYWTRDLLRYGGSGSGNCSVDTSSGYACGGSRSMLLCTESGTDPEGNQCVWTSCGPGSTSPNLHFGGCASTAGTVCFTGP